MTSSTFQTVKLALVSVTGLSKDSLHVYVGLGVYLLVVLLVRKRFWSLVPWLAVLSVALLGEALDMKDDISSWAIGAGQPVFTTSSIQFFGLQSSWPWRATRRFLEANQSTHKSPLQRFAA
jgi:hypothetical protein